MTDTLVSDARVFPEDRGTGLQVAASDGDIVSAGDLAGLALQHGVGQYVESGLEIAYDGSGPSVTISRGLAFLRYDGGVTVQDEASGEYVVDWSSPIVFAALVGGAETLPLASNAVNDIWLYLNRSQDGGDGIYYRHGAQSEIAEPSAPALKIATVDTTDGTVTTENYLPDLAVEDLEAQSATVGGSRVLTESTTEDVQASVSQGGTLLVDDPTDINLISGLAGTDDGDGTVSVGIASGGVSEEMLGFDVVTQAGFDTHIGTSDIHHTRYADEEAQDAVGAITDATLVYDDAGPGLGVAANSIGASHLTFDPTTQSEFDAHDHTGDTIMPDSVTAGAVDSDTVSGEVFAREFSGADLSAKIQNALMWISNNQGGHGRIRVTPKPDGTPWQWTQDLTLSIYDYAGIEIDVDNNAEIEYSGSGWMLTVDGTDSSSTLKQRESSIFKLTGGVWTATATSPTGWLRAQDTFGLRVFPQYVEFRNDTSDAVCIQLENHSEFNEGLRIGGQYVTDIGVNAVPARETGGSGSNSFHDAVLDQIHINAYSYGMRLAGEWQYSEMIKPAIFVKTDGVTCIELDAGLYSGLTLVSAKFEDPTAGAYSNTTGIHQLTAADAWHTPLLVNPKFQALATNTTIESSSGLTMIDNRGGETRIIDANEDGADFRVKGDGHVEVNETRFNQYGGIRSLRGDGHLFLSSADGELVLDDGVGNNLARYNPVSAGGDIEYLQGSGRYMGGANGPSIETAENLAGKTGNYNGEVRMDDGSNTAARMTACTWDETNSVWRPVNAPDRGAFSTATDYSPDYTVVASDSVALSSGSAVVATGVTTTNATLQVALGVQDPDADTKVAARAFWDDSAGEHKVEIVEDGTSVGTPTVTYDVIRWS